jgi:hypothetical protein
LPVGDADAELDPTAASALAETAGDPPADALAEATATVTEDCGAGLSVLDASEQPTAVKTTINDATNETRQRIAQPS